MKILKNKIVYEKNINNLDWKASAVVFPDSLQEIKSIVKLGAGNGSAEVNSNGNLDIIARGSGTSFTGATIPNNSVIIDFSKMNKILSIDTNKKIAIVEPGVLVSELNEELEKFNLEFPIIPLFEGIETIGGMLAKNSSGSREIKYGRMMNWTDSLEVIDAKGEQIRVSKSDLSDFIGMEGTTGMIVQAALRLTNKKQRTLTILKAGSLQDVFIANRKLRLKQDVCSIDLTNPTISSLLGLEGKYHLFIELESDEGNFKNEAYDSYMKLKKKFYKKSASEGFIYMSNAKFLIDSLQDFLIYLEEQKIPYFSHLVSGVVYPLFRHEDILKMSEAARIAKRLRGRIAYSFGIGLTKKDALEPGEIDLLKRVKNRRDLEQKFNRNKLTESAPMIIKKPEEKPKIEEKKEEQKEEIKPEETKKEELAKAETLTLKRSEPELSPEEREKIKKIAAGFFAGGKKA